MRRVQLTCVVLALLAAGSTSFATAGGSETGRYWVIVHPDNPATELEKAEVSRIFLKKETRWADGRAVAPVDLVEKAPARLAFSRDVLGRPPAAVKKYWQQMVFTGQAAPPPEVATEDDVLEMVRKDPAAIGYVSDEVVLKGVKILDVVEPPPPPRKAGSRPRPR
jgi:ABC-type phosphate transport system substrate-binding protein